MNKNIVSLKNIHVGQELTLLSRGVHRSGFTSTTWIDTERVGDTDLFKVSKVGTKYLYGHYVRSEEGKMVQTEWESKLNPEDYVFLDGFHAEYRKQYHEYRQNLAAHDNARSDARYKYENALRDVLNNKMDVWDKQHPRPQPLDLAKLEEAKQ